MNQMKSSWKNLGTKPLSNTCKVLSEVRLEESCEQVMTASSNPLSSNKRSALYAHKIRFKKRRP